MQGRRDDTGPAHQNAWQMEAGRKSFEQPYRIERNLLCDIATGRTDHLKEMALDPGRLLPDVGETPMSQQKISGIIAITIISRYAISKGMDVNTSLGMSDTYIRQIEKAAGTAELAALLTSAYIEYSKRLTQQKIPEGTKPVVEQCIQYIRESVNMPLTVASVAAHVDRSLTYVSSRFKAELGFSMSSFITRCKIEEAKSLLAFTDMSLAEISSYLCFSDQSYFHRRFKAITGVTPGEYRKENHL